MSNRNALDRAIGYVAPVWQANRDAARKTSELLSGRKPVGDWGWNGGTNSADSRNSGRDKEARTARELERTFDMAKCALDIWTRNNVGTGWTTEPMIRKKPTRNEASGGDFEELNECLLDDYDIWQKTADVTGELSNQELQRLASRHQGRDGEVFAQKVTGKVRGLPYDETLERIPFWVELIGSEMVPTDYTVEEKRIYQGVQKNAWGRPENYYVKKHDPESTKLQSFTEDYKRVSADRLIHLKLSNEVRQTRGTSVFVSALERMQCIRDMEEAELVAGKMASMIFGAIHRATGYQAPAPGKDGTKANVFDLAPGTMIDHLQPGESIELFNHSRPNNRIEPFLRTQYRALGCAVGTGYSELTNDYNGSYSSQRQELVNVWRGYAVTQNDFVCGFVDPVWRAFVDAWMLTARSDAKRGTLSRKRAQLLRQADVRSIYDSDHRGPRMPWISPKDEATANKMLLEMKVESRSQQMRARGENPRSVWRQIQADKEFCKQMEIDLE